MENNEIIGSIPWPVAIATAAWFGFMAYKANKNFVVWAIGGGVLGLVVTTIVLGLGQATFIPYSSQEIAPFRLKLAILAIFLVLGIGWLFTGSLHRNLLAALRGGAAATPDQPPKPPATDLK